MGSTAIDTEDERILAFAETIGLTTSAPYDAELLTAFRGIRSMAARLDQAWAAGAEPAFRFALPGDIQKEPKL